MNWSCRCGRSFSRAFHLRFRETISYRKSGEILSRVENSGNIRCFAVSLPAQVPEQRLRKQQKAFISTLKDPQFLAEADKSKLQIGPIDGPGIEKMVNGLYEIEPAVLSRVKQILESK
jgi:hypothetical protein